MDTIDAPYPRFPHWVQTAPKDIPMTPPRDTTGSRNLQLLLAMEAGGGWEAPTETALTRREATSTNYRRLSPTKDATLSARDVHIQNKSRTGSITTNYTNHSGSLVTADPENKAIDDNMQINSVKSTIDAKEHSKQDELFPKSRVSERVPNGIIPPQDQKPSQDEDQFERLAPSVEDGIVTLFTKKRTSRKLEEKKAGFGHKQQLKEQSPALSTMTRAQSVNTGTFIKQDIRNSANVNTGSVENSAHSARTNSSACQDQGLLNATVTAIETSNVDYDRTDLLSGPHYSQTARGQNKHSDIITCRRETTYTKTDGGIFSTKGNHTRSPSSKVNRRSSSRKRGIGKETEHNTRTLPATPKKLTHNFPNWEEARALRFFKVVHSAPQSRFSSKMSTPHQEQRSKTQPDILTLPDSKEPSFFTVSQRHQGRRRSHQESLHLPSRSNTTLNSDSLSSYRNKSRSFYSDNNKRLPDNYPQETNFQPSLLSFKQTKRKLPKPIVIPSVLLDEDSFVREPTFSANKWNVRCIADHDKSPEISTVMAELYGNRSYMSTEDSEESELAHLREYSELSIFEK